MRVRFLIPIVAAGVAMQLSAAPPKTSSGRLDIAGDKLYIAGIGHGFHVFDISDPLHPKWSGSWQNHTCPVGVQVVEGLAYLANRTSGFDVIDVHDPASPALIGHFNAGGDMQTVQVTGHYAYVADLRRGWDIIDVSDPKQPKLAGDFETKGQGWSAIANGNYLYAGYGGGVLRIFHLDNGTNPKLVKEIPGAGSTGQQIARGELITQHFGRLCLMGLENPASPAVIADSQVGFGVSGSVCVSDSLMFMTYMGLGIFDLGKPGKVQLLGSIGDVGYQGHGIGVYEHYAYVVDGGANLHIFDVSNPARPVEVNRVGTENFCSQVLTLTNFVTDHSAAGIQAGTSGAITDAPPQLADAMRTADGAFSFTLRGVPEGTYFIQASADLISWANISTNSLPLGGTLRISDPDAHLFDSRFYRAVKKQ
ncbi:MAG: hypothetical protein WCS42_03655 [Verrucomicrobiota bacterium]